MTVEVHDSRPSSPATVKRHYGSSTIRPVVTSPPWAKHEPPCPDLESDPIHPDLLPLSRPHAVPSDVASYSSTTTSDHRRWHFPLLKPLRRGSVAWNPRPGHAREDSSDEVHEEPAPSQQDSYFGIAPGDSPLRVLAPRNGLLSGTGFDAPSTDVLDHPYTLAQNRTPGWATPWAPNHAIFRPNRVHLRDEPASLGVEPHQDRDEEKLADTHPLNSWQRIRRDFRSFFLANTYVPLILRLLNLSFTTSTLVVGIRIRRMELDNNIMGAMGSSPLLAIFFSPLTLVHVMVAIYLEYFGRPLGLWKTSAKLAHTLSEVIFICAWSGSFSVAFENYFISPLLCTPPTSNLWWSHLPPTSSPLAGQTGRHQGGVADRICADQLAMICLEAFGLGLYCSNLVISLYRIFEKVKYHTSAVRSVA